MGMNRTPHLPMASSLKAKLRRLLPYPSIAGGPASPCALRNGACLGGGSGDSSRSQLTISKSPQTHFLFPLFNRKDTSLSSVWFFFPFYPLQPCSGLTWGRGPGQEMASPCGTGAKLALPREIPWSRKTQENVTQWGDRCWASWVREGGKVQGKGEALPSPSSSFLGLFALSSLAAPMM